ncbi:16S rRNA (adenine(1518)-N(6)/adenine(1519)-N(6))-dimethyltransferase RsmA [Halalkalibacillus halophilus]|uniref:16S rRNA (adenine(1518)-N(6)/adenine(1519)-N(6))- dimethyltransferase RsmA n=1 Tax=Halalkalibacillus halophilus TaxID=392827 RepID=UPI00041759CE|nr:16S rRNA (adenine(1518)-N(6)/adenine(1519)-N(6))-dimethyltransferase RsmA [Halalkalibacillus halophilus]
MKAIATYTRTKAIMERHKLSFKKSLGQNFLIDVNILEKIVHKAGIDDNSFVIEIGPGIGALTEQLALKANQVHAFEIDGRLIEVLNETLDPYDNVSLYHQDILEADLISLIKEKAAAGQEVHVVANLPYYITTAILMKLLKDQAPIDTITVMMQKEVAARMAAGPNTKDYGSLSIAVQYLTESKVVMDVPKTCFVPQPNVDSAILQLHRRKEKAVDVSNEDLFFTLMQASFGQRRKTIRNNLKREFEDRINSGQLDQLLEQAGIEPSRRGESLSIEEFARLANTFDSFLN